MALRICFSSRLPWECALERRRRCGPGSLRQACSSNSFATASGRACAAGPAGTGDRPNLRELRALALKLTTIPRRSRPFGASSVDSVYCRSTTAYSSSRRVEIAFLSVVSNITAPPEAARLPRRAMLELPGCGRWRRCSWDGCEGGLRSSPRRAGEYAGGRRGSSPRQQGTVPRFFEPAR